VTQNRVCELSKCKCKKRLIMENNYLPKAPRSYNNNTNTFLEGRFIKNTQILDMLPVSVY
jgi:hypothetical protein